MAGNLHKLIGGDFPEREINRLAIPAIIASIAEPLISIGDAAIIGQYAEKDSVSLGAVAVGSTFFLSIIWVFAQTRTAMSSVMSRYYGEKKLEAVRTLVPQMTFMNFMLGLFFYLFTNLFSREIFTLYNVEGQQLEETIRYFSIRSIGFPFVLSTMMMFGVFRGIQNTVWAMSISLVGGLINILLDQILIGGVDGFISPMGIEGVAFASLCAQLVMFVMAIFFLYKKAGYSLNFMFPVNQEVYWLLRLTGNLIIRSLAVQTAYFFSGRIAAGCGPHYLNVHGVFWNIWLFSAFFIEGYCSAGNALAGKFYGEKNPEMLWRLSKFMIKRTIAIGVGLTLIYFITYRWIGHLFLTNSTELEIFYSAFWLVALVQPFNAFAFTYDELLKGIGEMKYIRNTLIIATFIGFVPVIHFLDFMEWHLLSVWSAFIVWMSIRGGRLMLYFNRNFSY